MQLKMTKPAAVLEEFAELCVCLLPLGAGGAGDRDALSPRV